MDMRKKGLDSLRKDLRSKSHVDELAPVEVTVGADSEEGLEEGLELAKDVVGKVPMKKSHAHPMDDLDDELSDLGALPEKEESIEQEADEMLAKLQESPELMKAIMSKLSL